MARPKKEQPNRADGLYEVKRIVGHKMDGEPIRKSFYSSISKADAEAKYMQYKLEHEIANITGEGFKERDVTFAVWARKWMLTIRGTVKDSTYALTYVNSVENHLIPYFGASYLSDIQQINVQSYFSNAGQKLAKETLKKIYRCLYQIMESAIDNNLLNRNPCRNIKLTSNIKPIVKQVYSEEDVSRLIEYARTHRYGLEIETLVRLGLSRSELLGIQWDDIDCDNQILHIKHGVADVKNSITGKMEVVVGEPKTEYRVRDVPLPKDLVQAIQNKPRYVKIRSKQSQKTVETDFVFHNAQGQVCSPRTWSRRHYDVFMSDMHTYYLNRDIDMPILTPHELRHTCASLFVNSDKNLYAIATLLGWADLKMLKERYAHPDINAIRSNLELE